jgi:hypothetical protein
MLYLFIASKNGRDTRDGVVVCASPTGSVQDATVVERCGVLPSASLAMQAAYKEAVRLTGDKNPRTDTLPGTRRPCYVVPWQALPVAPAEAWGEAELDEAAGELW